MIQVALISNTPKTAYLQYINFKVLQNAGINLNINPSSGNYDYCIVHSKGLKQPLTLNLPKGRLILITGEPRGIYYYSKSYLNQFDEIYTSRDDIKLKGVKIFQSHPYQVPWVGRQSDNGEVNYFIKNNVTPNRHNKICIITSNKVYCRGHLIRKKFVDYVLKNHSDIFDVYGFGYRSIGDKAEILKSYRFTLAIENTIELDYWTEKIHDAILCGCFPFYYGAPNMDKYLNVHSFQSIDISNPKLACAQIIQTIENNYFNYSVDKSALDKYLIHNFITQNCIEKGLEFKRRKIHGDLNYLNWARLRLVLVRLFWKIKSKL